MWWTYERKARPLPGSGPLQHLQVAVGVAEGGDGPTADVLVDADRLAFLVVDEVEFRQANQNGRALAHLVLRLDAAADDLLGGDAVDRLRSTGA